MRECSKCKGIKDSDQFSQWTDKRTGKAIISARCKACAADYSRKRYAANREKLREQMKQRYAKNRDEALKKAKVYYEANKDSIKAAQRRYFERNKSTCMLRVEEWKKANWEQYRAAQDRWVKANPEKVRASANRYFQSNKHKVAERWQAMRMMVFEAYGGARCKCCGEENYAFLTIDHVNNDGAAHRAAIGKHLYRWLIEHDYPEGFQVLCMNCNFGKHRNNGVCPHQDLESSSTIPQGSTLQAIGSGSARPPLG